MIARDEAQRLSRAQLYVVSPDMADVVAAAARTLTGEDLDLLEADDLPSPTGCLVLPEVMWLRRVGDDLLSPAGRWCGMSVPWASWTLPTAACGRGWGCGSAASTTRPRRH
jgi:hypothetical protein